ncbi:riboflavin synthase, partial [Streptomyces albidoflavus]
EVWPSHTPRTSGCALAPAPPLNPQAHTAAAPRLGGHLVQGHVDGVGTLIAREPSTHWELVTVSLPAHLARYVVEKGSITVDGVSLTVVEAGEEHFTISLIPTTLALTTLGHKQPGDPVNLEVDVIAKYVERMLGHRAAPATAGEESR